MQRPTRVAIYARVSTTEQDPEAQLFALRAYAAQRGFEVYREYIDYVSGGKPERTAPRHGEGYSLSRAHGRRGEAPRGLRPGLEV